MRRINAPRVRRHISVTANARGITTKFKPMVFKRSAHVNAHIQHAGPKPTPCGLDDPRLSLIFRLDGNQP